MNNKVNIIYLLGAGRSGTTLLSTIINSHPNIKTIGEMHQFFEHNSLNKHCSCGEKLKNCESWKPVIESLGFNELNFKEYDAITKSEERHKNTLKLLLGLKHNDKYLKLQNRVFETTQKHTKEEWLLDSSKYISRYLLLKRSNILNVKGIYVVRDVRGVINSFSKKVQTPRKPISTIFYYLMINFFGELVYRLDRNVIKVKYEDFVKDPIIILDKIYSHVLEVEINNIGIQDEYKMPHIIGGNRMKILKKVTIKNDNKWLIKIPRAKQILYAILAFPTMILNKYKL